MFKVFSLLQVRLTSQQAGNVASLVTWSYVEANETGFELRSPGPQCHLVKLLMNSVTLSFLIYKMGLSMCDWQRPCAHYR